MVGGTPNCTSRETSSHALYCKPRHSGGRPPPAVGDPSGGRGLALGGAVTRRKELDLDPPAVRGEDRVGAQWESSAVAYHPLALGGGDTRMRKATPSPRGAGRRRSDRLLSLRPPRSRPRGPVNRSWEKSPRWRQTGRCCRHQHKSCRNNNRHSVAVGSASHRDGDTDPPLWSAVRGTVPIERPYGETMFYV